MPAWLVAFAVAAALQVATYILTPKPKAPKPEAARDAEGPTAEAGRPMPVIWGTIEIKGLNVLWSGDKSVRQYEVDA